MTPIPFTKAQGAGNDFLIIESSHQAAFSAPEQRQRFCDRRFGVGADGVIFLARVSEGGVDAEIRLFNSDGEEAEISGNGTRCAAAYLLGGAGERREAVVIRTQAGLKRLRLMSRAENRFELEMHMGEPVLEAAKIPFRPPAGAREPVVGFELPLAGGGRAVTVTSMGNPHCTIFVQDYDWDWRAAGREIERHPFFPQRTNVEFCRVKGEHEIEVRFWERGVGETLSSGTGSCAAAVAAMLHGKVESPVAVHTPGGVLKVRRGEDGIYLSGPAEIICRGEYYAGA